VVAGMLPQASVDYLMPPHQPNVDLEEQVGLPSIPCTSCLVPPPPPPGGVGGLRLVAQGRGGKRQAVSAVGYLTPACTGPPG
jgi:hypothetical protein